MRNKNCRREQTKLQAGGRMKYSSRQTEEMDKENDKQKDRLVQRRKSFQGLLPRWWGCIPGPGTADAPAPGPAPADLEDSLGEARLLRELLQVLGVGVVVNGKVRLHGPKLVVLEGSAHALGLLRGGVWLLIPVQVVGLILVTTCGSHSGQTRAQWQVLHQLKRWQVARSCHDPTATVEKAVAPIRSAIQTKERG